MSGQAIVARPNRSIPCWVWAHSGEDFLPVRTSTLARQALTARAALHDDLLTTTSAVTVHVRSDACWASRRHGSLRRVGRYRYRRGAIRRPVQANVAAELRHPAARVSMIAARLPESVRFGPAAGRTIESHRRQVLDLSPADAETDSLGFQRADRADRDCDLLAAPQVTFL